MKKFSSFLVDISAGLFAFCVVLAFAGVIFRKFLNNSIIWSEEVIRYTFIWLFFLAMPEVTRYGGHLALDLVPMALNEKDRRILYIVVECFCIALDIAIVYFGIKISIMNMSQYSASLRIPYGYIYMAIPTGSTLMGIFSIRRIVLLIKKKEETE